MFIYSYLFISSEDMKTFLSTNNSDFQKMRSSGEKEILLFPLLYKHLLSFQGISMPLLEHSANSYFIYVKVSILISVPKHSCLIAYTYEIEKRKLKFSMIFLMLIV